MILDFANFDNVIIVCPFSIKEQILIMLSKSNTLKNIKILDDHELTREVNYQYDQKTINYLFFRKNIKPAIAKIYLKNILELEDNIDYKSKKIQFLVKLKEELIAQNLLKKEPIINNYQKVLVCGFNKISKKLIKDLKKLNLDYQIIENIYINKENIVFEFEKQDDEVIFVIKEIASLLDKGIDINHIKIANADESYQLLFHKYEKMFNFSFAFQNNEYLINLVISKEFLNILEEKNDYSVALNFLKEKQISFNLYNAYLKIINDYIDYQPKDALPLIIEQLKQTKIIKDKLFNCIEFIDFYHNIYDGEYYVFAVGINQNVLPKVYKNDDFFSDEEKILLALDTSYDLNKLEEENFALEIRKPYHLCLTYKLKTPFEHNFKSQIIEKLNLKVIKPQLNNLISFSEIYDKINLSQKLDNLYKKSDDYSLSLLYSNYQIPYKQFDNSYHQIDSAKLKDYFEKQKINLSYSSMNSFYECQFKYYLNYVLKLKDNQSTSFEDIGKLFHYILEKQDDKDFNFDTYYDSYIEEYNSNEEAFYVQKLKKLLKDILDINKENLQYTKFNKFLYEQEVKINFEKPLKLYFKGFIDKIMYYVENDITYVSIIDYKTGNADINLNNIEFGLSLQLPVYLYLIKHTDIFKNVVVVGFYLQKLLHESVNAKDSYYDILKNELKLNGYSLNQQSILQKFDSTYENSKIIKSIKTTKTGDFQKRSKVLSVEEMEKINKIVETKIQDAINMIAKADFKINPKIQNNKNLSCTYCEFEDCCFKKASDYVYLAKKQFGGENDE